VSPQSDSPHGEVFPLQQIGLELVRRTKKRREREYASAGEGPVYETELSFLSS